MRPNTIEIRKIWEWTKDDTNSLFKPFILNNEPGGFGLGPSSGYAIYLFCMMDIWGSIFRNSFNKWGTGKNIVDFLERLKQKYPDLYEFGDKQLLIVADELRNNVVHNYGLRVIESNNNREWLNIDVNSPMQVINIQDDDRWHIDCMRLKDHLLEIIREWLLLNNYVVK